MRTTITWLLVALPMAAFAGGGATPPGGPIPMPEAGSSLALVGVAFGGLALFRAFFRKK